jgi:nitroreductase
MRNPAPVDHPVHELIRERWSPRAFADRSVAPRVLCSLFEAARWAPSSFNEQPWSFIVARRDEADEFARLLACLVAANQAWARRAPVLAVSVAALEFARDGRPNRHALHDVGLAAAQLTLQAGALGLAVHQMAGIDRDKVRATYGIPEGFEPVTALAIGYPGESASPPQELGDRERAPRRRKPLSEFIFAGQWGATARLAP